jgi:hypothetical protein
MRRVGRWLETRSLLERNRTLCGSEDSQNMPYLLQAKVLWRRCEASASEDENATALLSLSVFRDFRESVACLEVLQGGAVCLLPTAGLKAKMTTEYWLKAKGVREKPVPMPLYPPQIPHRLA